MFEKSLYEASHFFFQHFVFVAFSVSSKDIIILDIFTHFEVSWIQKSGFSGSWHDCVCVLNVTYKQITAIESNLVLWIAIMF